jgi:hypothetical protein
MSQLLDGPAGPTLLFNQRSPRFLRVVVDENGQVDCLDQLIDAPAEGEQILVYEVVQGSGGDYAHVTLDRPKRCVRVPLSSYRHRPDVDGETVRETDAWQAWCYAQPRRDRSEVSRETSSAQAAP